MLTQVRSLQSLPMLVHALKEAWRGGGIPDARGALHEHPELLSHRSLVVDLVYEEYCLREEGGEVPDAEEFCRQFPRFKSYIREVIRGHRLLADNPDLLQSPPNWPESGDVVDQLVIIGELGRGAFARVYLASEPETGDRLVVLKLTVARSAEARTLGAMTHDHIVSVLWARQLDGFFAVCMPFVGMATLRDGIEQWFQPEVTVRSARTLLAALAVPEPIQLPAPATPALTGRESHAEAVAEIASRLADAVGYLHSRGIAHGDLKPSNILLAPGAHPYLIDFNLATDEKDSLLRRGGTLPYMPPEQLTLLLGGPRAGTAMAGDVYSFGAVLFEAFTGRVPFDPGAASEPNSTARELLRLRAACGTSPTRGTRIPKPLAQLIDACLDPNPAARPSIEQLKQRIDRYRHRHRRLRFPLALGGVVVAAAVSWAAIPKTEPLTQPPQKPAEEVRAPQTAEEVFARGLRCLKADDTKGALSEFQSAYRLDPSGRNAAYLAYSYGPSENSSTIQFYREAVGKKFAPAWVHNNLARALNLSGLPENLHSAVMEANQALKLQEGMTTARMNRADARYRLRLANLDPNPNLAEVVADIQAAMPDHSGSMGLHVFAALATVKFGENRDECYANAVRYLERAVDLGFKPTHLADDAVLAPLKNRQDFKDLLERTQGRLIKESDRRLQVAPPLD